MSIIIGTPQPNTLEGTFGSDYIDGRAGNDTIFGYTLVATSNPSAVGILDEADTIFGGAGNDLIRSGGGADFVDGGRGNDTIVGGNGIDLLHGGAGRDVFKFEVVSLQGATSPPRPVVDTMVGEGQRDVILDFQKGRDKIDVTGWENRENSQNSGAHFIGQQDPSSAPDLQIGFRHEAGNTIVELTGTFFAPGSEPTTLVVTGEIQIQGEFRLHASDFIF